MSESDSELTIVASGEQIDSAVKTVTDDETLEISWLSGDAINVFLGASEGSIFVTNTTGRKAEFKGTISAVTGGGESLTDDTSLWGVYPYQNSTTCDGTSITYTLPSKQEAKAGSFADDLWPQIARSRNFYMSFYSLCGSFRFVLYRNDIVKVTLSGNNGESLAGKAKVNMPLGDVPVVEEIIDGESTLTMTAPDGVFFESGKNYYFVLYPTEFTKSVTLTYYTKESKAVLKGTNPITLGRNKLMRFNQLDKNLEFVPLEEEGGESGESSVKVQTIYMIPESATLAPGTSYVLDTDYEPYNATNTTWKWSSSDASVAYVDDSGKVSAIADGETTITATATDGSGVSASSTITVKAAAVASAEYKDEYGVNHGRGIAIGDVVWAPVNCGYKAPTLDAQGNVVDKGYPYGKLYQWGRKYGQGYSLKYDATAPSEEDGTLVKGPVEISEGQLKANADKFYMSTSSPYDWALFQNDKLWNAGTEDEPKKETDYDPCPDGWRVPTFKELSALDNEYSLWAPSKDMQGYWFSGEYTYQEDAPQVLFPAACFRYYDGFATSSGFFGFYWCSRPNGFKADSMYFDGGGVLMDSDYRGYGYSVRCVQE